MKLNRLDVLRPVWIIVYILVASFLLGGIQSKARNPEGKPATR